MKILVSFALAFTLVITGCNAGPTIQSGDAVQAMTETIEQFVTAWNSDNVSAIESLFADDFVRTDNGFEQVSNRADYEAWMRAHAGAFPDGSTTIDRVTISGKQAFSYWTFRGTNTGAFGSTSATNRFVENRGFSVWTFNDAGEVIQEDVFTMSFVCVSS